MSNRLHSAPDLGAPEPARPENPRRSYRFWLHRSHLTSFVDVKNTTGLEIGALDLAHVEADEGQCEFADYRTTEELRELTRDVPGHNEDFVAPISYNLTKGYGVIGKKYDWVAASHVVEHVPNLLEWINTLSDLLLPEGVIFLVAPDKRYTFDFYRQATTLSEVVEAYQMKQTKPSYRQCFDHHYYHTPQIDPGQIWAGINPTPPVRNYATSHEVALRAMERYEDTHCSVFTPESFARILSEAKAAGLIRASIQELRSTQLNQMDFSVVLRV